MAFSNTFQLDLKMLPSHTSTAWRSPRPSVKEEAVENLIFDFVSVIHDKPSLNFPFLRANNTFIRFILGAEPQSTSIQSFLAFQVALHGLYIFLSFHKHCLCFWATITITSKFVKGNPNIFFFDFFVRMHGKNTIEQNHQTLRRERYWVIGQERRWNYILNLCYGNWCHGDVVLILEKKRRDMGFRETERGNGTKEGWDSSKAFLQSSSSQLPTQWLAVSFIHQPRPLGLIAEFRILLYHSRGWWKGSQ